MKTNITFKLGHESFIRVFRTIIKWILFQFHSSWLCRLWVTDVSRRAPIPSTPRIRHWGSLIKLETERRKGEKDEEDREKRKTFSFLFSPPLPPLLCSFVCFVHFLNDLTRRLETCYRKQNLNPGNLSGRGLGSDLSLKETLFDNYH